MKKPSKEAKSETSLVFRSEAEENVFMKSIIISWHKTSTLPNVLMTLSGNMILDATPYLFISGEMN